MAAQTPTTPPDPNKILESLFLYALPMSLKGALDLELFTHIAAGATTPAAIAPLCQSSEKGVRVLCDFLTVHGFLTKTDGAYGLTPTAAVFLDKKSHSYIGSIADFLTHETIRNNFSDVAAVVRKGGTVVHSTVSPNDPVWVEFARSMQPMMGLLSQLTAEHVATPGQPQKTLDIAASHGLFGLAIARLNPAAHITFLDWEAVLAVARENTVKMGLVDRVSYLPGSAFEVDFLGAGSAAGSGYDLILLPNFLHHFDEATNVTLLEKVRAAMKPGATLATVEFVPNDDRISPPMPATFSMMMLSGTESGDAYTFKEFDRMFRAAGFGSSVQHPLAPTPASLLVTQYAT